MTYSVCIDSVFGRIDPAESIRTVRDAGFTAVEFWSWHDRNLDALSAAVKENDVTIASFCAKAVSLVDPGKRSAYITALRESIAVARKLGSKHMIAQTGQDNGRDRREQHESIVAGLKEAKPFLEDAGITLLLEPLNTYIDHKGYYLWKSSEAYEIIDEVSSKNVRVLFDIYHQQIMEGNLIPNIQAGKDRIAYFHVAGHPGRHEPDIGEIHYPAVIEAISQTGYDGFIGLEYFPLKNPLESLRNSAKHLPQPLVKRSV